MPSSYLDLTELATYGLPDTVTAAQVAQASGLIDAYLTRKGGCVFSVDAVGAPCYMVGLQRTTRLASTSGITAGANVLVPYSNPPLDNNSVGEVVILDKDDDTKREACAISAVSNSPNSIQFYNVQFDHSAGCTIDFGLTLCEQKEMPNNRSTTRLSEWPIVNVQSGVGRYGYGRRSNQIIGANQDFNLLATVSNFGGPPLWTPWQVSQASISRNTGEIWVPAGILLAYYTEVKIWYVAGWTQSLLPPQIKQACANILNFIKETGLGANVRRRELPAGAATSKFENNLIDANTREILNPFKARNFM